MASKDQIKAQIRFALSQLRAQNGHHAFEELCRQLARARVAANILPATGPVSAGGDQGRDFETFRTYLAQQPHPSGAFTAHATEEDVAFICTLQVEDVISKIRDDLAKVVELGEDVISKIRDDLAKVVELGAHVDAVYVFLEADVEVARRHRLQEEASQQYGLRLEIFDGNAVSEQLSDRDTFWIAERYLHMPADLYPREDGSPSWYEDSLSRWRERGKPELTHGDFGELKEAIRYATFDPTLVQDLHFWIGLLNEFRSQEATPRLRRAAVYEIVVASLVGLQTLDDAENGLASYFGDLEASTDPADIQDAQILIMFLEGGRDRGLLAATGDRVAEWKSALLSRAIDLLERASQLSYQPPDRCILMEAIALLHFPVYATGKKDPSALDETLDWWGRLLDEASKVPLFPLQRMAQYVGEMAPLLSQHARYPDLTARLDELTAQRAGQAAAAGSRRDRAVSLRRAGTLIFALREFHQAKIDWFTGDTVRGSLLTIALIGRCYEDLRLYFAARYYYLAVGWGALKLAAGEHKDLTPRVLWSLADVTYQQGFWLGFFDWLRVAIGAHLNLVPDPYDLASHPELERAVLHASIAMAYSRRFLPQHTALIEKRLQDLGLMELVAEQFKQVDAYVGRASDESLLENVCHDLHTTPFNDAGEHRSVTWAALGLRWRVNFRNDYFTTLAAERFVAISQIIAADLADRDLCLLRTDVVVDIELTNGTSPVIRYHASNRGRRWTIGLQPWDAAGGPPRRDEMLSAAMGAVAAVLRDVSLLPKTQFAVEIESLFKGGVKGKILAINLYDLLVAELLSEDRFHELHRETEPAPDSGCDPFELGHNELSWRGGLGPIYSKATLDGMIRQRYQVLERTLSPLLPKLLADQSVRETLRQLRAEGWKDWHLMMAIQNLVLSYFATNGDTPGQDAEAASRAFVEQLTQGRTSLSEWLSEKKFRVARMTAMIGSVRALGLELHQQTLDVTGLEDFLGTRYRYWSDDVTHDDPFPGLAEEASRDPE